MKADRTLTKGTSQWEGWGTALKPALEPITVARKPLEKGLTIAENVLKYGTGGINIDESRVGTNDKLQVLHGSFTFSGGLGADTKGKKIEFVDSGLGRFPANLIHDGSDEVVSLFPQANHKTGSSKGAGFQDKFVGGEAKVELNCRDITILALPLASSTAPKQVRVKGIWGVRGYH